MITPQQSKNLKQLLKHASSSSEPLKYDELLGFLFGAAIVPPDLVSENDLLTGVFDDTFFIPEKNETTSLLYQNLLDVLNNHRQSFIEGKLKFPFEPMHVSPRDFKKMQDWVFGFAEALDIFQEFWDPAQSPSHPGVLSNQVLFALDVFDALTDDESTDMMIENIPDSFLAEVYQHEDRVTMDKQTQVIMFLLSSLPSAVEILMEHAHSRAAGRQTASSKQPVSFLAKKDQKKKAGTKAAAAKSKASPKQKKQSEQESSLEKSGKIIYVDFAGKANQQDKSSTLLTLRINLLDSNPAVWRRVEAPGWCTLGDVHAIIQIAMGWKNSHLHEFICDETVYGMPQEVEENMELQDENSITLADLMRISCTEFRYVYDFGDYWQHDIIIEKQEKPSGQPVAQLLDGAGACPPEDCGGIYAYTDFIDSLRQPKSDEYAFAREVLGPRFNPNTFTAAQITKINRRLQKFS